MKPFNELSEREQLILNIWEAWKDFYGFRPRHIDFESMSDKELEDLYERSCRKSLIFESFSDERLDYS